MEIQIAVAKCNKHDSRDSGDTLEVVERPTGGMSVVLADGQIHGKASKSVSTMVVRKVIALLAEGVRDGAAARAASDALFTEKNGEASACLSIISADLQTKTFVIARNTPVPVIIAQREHIKSLSSLSSPVGTAHDTRPAISEIPLESGTTVVMHTDGLTDAGASAGLRMDICTLLESLLEEQEPTSQEIADTILAEAVRLDHGMPKDDMSIVVLRVIAHETDQIRRMSIRIPVSEASF